MSQQFSRINEVLAGLGFHERNTSSFSKLFNVKVENTSFYAFFLKKTNLLSMKKYEHKRSQKDGTYCVECTRGSPVSWRWYRNKKDLKYVEIEV